MRTRLPILFSTTALLVAVLGVTPLGEAAYNAVVPRNSVGTLQLQRNAVKAAKVAPNAIRTGHVLDGTLLVSDFKPGQIPQGQKGDKGDAGPSGVSGLQLVTQASASDSTSPKFVTATCPTGKTIIGGGANVNLLGVSLYRSSPGAPGVWGAGASETSPTSNTWSVTAYAYCAKITP